MRVRVWLFAAVAALAAQVSPMLSIIAAQSITLPHHVQGTGAASPVAGSTLTVRGVVIARTSSGFFLQTEVGFEDADPNTSEGLFVNHVIDSALVGHAVTATGTVSEAGSLTQLQSVSGVTDEGESPLPEAFELTDVELSAAGPADQLERFEGMRVSAMLTSVSPTALDGSFFAVVAGVERPVRGPGVRAGAPALPCAAGPCDFESFDGNPERLRVDSDGTEGAAVVDVGVETFVMTSGPLGFSAGHYTLLPEATLLAMGGIPQMWAGGASDGQYSVASMNLGAPSADAAAYDRRLEKASLMVRWVLGSPDVIAVQQADTATVLADLAARINADAALSGEAPGYSAQLDGFLVKTSRVSVVSAAHVGAAGVFARQPVMLRAVINGGAPTVPQRLTTINTEFRSLDDVDQDNAAGQQARAERQAQAEWLANFVDDLQASNPGERILAVGNYNAHEFNDGYVDVVGTVMGTPAPASRVVLASPNLVSRPLHDLMAPLHASLRYSSISDGNAQSLDHLLASANLAAQFQGVTLARVNADFPEILRDAPGDPARLSDRDPMVAFFSFPTDGTAPVFDAQPQDVQASATDPAGVAVAYALPTATDDVDASVVVSCAPASGSVFAVGNTAVNCSVQDEAGNEATAAFTVTVTLADTTAPVLTVPANITEAATSASGRQVQFAVSATDAVDGPVGVTCVPASGSTFPIGTTVVACSASDAAGNQANAAFNVTITGTQSQAGHMVGDGVIRHDDYKVTFAFDVRQSSSAVDRGWFVLLSKKGYHSRNALAGVVTSVVFTPGANGLNSVTFSGVGCWNGRSNYRFEVTAADRGQPGVGRDTFSVVIKSPSGKVVETHSGVLSEGNVKSRR